MIIEPVFGADTYLFPPCLKQRNYSIALLRHWFIYHFLLAENANHKSLHIGGIGKGQERHVEFIEKAVRSGYPKVCFLKWETLDDKSTIKQIKQYDVIISTNLSGGEQNPESMICGLIGLLKENGILIGISRNFRIRKGDELKLTLKTIRRIAKKNNLSVDFLSGGFFRRRVGLVPYHKKRWFRFNLLLGALLPSLANEIYWVYRK